MHRLTRKEIFKLKLKGQPIKITFNFQTIKLLVHCGIIEDHKDGRYIVRYPVIMLGSWAADQKDELSLLVEDWHTLPVDARICNPGDTWDLR